MVVIGCKQGKASTTNTQFALKSMGEVSYFLGIEVSKKSSGFDINQSQYIADILDKNNMLDCN